ncbi:MAG TPA: hypothetical protein VGG39_24295 [Polyangiaceae bacterium]|jgi:hypothetical protein
MKTVVFQSCRIENVPSWLSACQESVRRWTESQGHDYRFLDDRFFECVPEWLRHKVRNGKLPMSDYARLHHARAFLEGGYERAIWLDSDVVVFDPEAFSRNNGKRSFAVTREVWLEMVDSSLLAAASSPRSLTLEEDRRLQRLALQGGASGTGELRPHCFHQVANAVLFFDTGCALLPFYLSAIESYARDARGPIQPIVFGPRFLTTLHQVARFPLVRDVGMLSPLVLDDLYAGTVEHARFYMKEFAEPMSAANVCASFAGSVARGVEMTDERYERAIRRLLDSRGACLNELVVGPGAGG